MYLYVICYLKKRIGSKFLIDSYRTLLFDTWKGLFDN